MKVRKIWGQKVEIIEDFVPYEVSLPSYIRALHRDAAHVGDGLRTPEQALKYLATYRPIEG